MNEINYSPKPKFLPVVNKQTKLSVQIQQKSFDLISEYRAFLKEASSEDVSPGALVSAFINHSVISDKSFVKWRQEKLKKETKTEQRAEPKPKKFVENSLFPTTDLEA